MFKGASVQASVFQLYTLKSFLTSNLGKRVSHMLIISHSSSPFIYGGKKKPTKISLLEGMKDVIKGVRVFMEHFLQMGSMIKSVIFIADVVISRAPTNTITMVIPVNMELSTE